MKATAILFLLGLILGLAAGLYYTWMVNPVQYYNSLPALMRSDYRADWIKMTALAYAQEGNLARAEARLNGLANQEVQQVLARVLDEAVALGRPLPILQRLATLAAHYGADTPAVRIYQAAAPVPPSPLPPTDTPSPTPTATPTATPRPTATATPTPRYTATPRPTPTPLIIPLPDYTVVSLERLCEVQPRLLLTVTEAVTVTAGRETRSELRPLPGLALWLVSGSETQHAVTGMRPEINPGYADFAVRPNSTCNLYVAAPSGVPVATLAIEPCAQEDEDSALWTSWSLTLRRRP